MVSTIVSAVAASDWAIGIVIAGCVLLLIACELVDDELRPVPHLFSRNLAIFSVPLLVLFVYLAIVWGTGIIRG